MCGHRVTDSYTGCKDRHVAIYGYFPLNWTIKMAQHVIQESHSQLKKNGFFTKYRVIVKILIGYILAREL